MSFEIAFVLEPAGLSATDLVVQVRARPRGAFRLMTPLVARTLPKTSERITSQMVALVEASTEAALPSLRLTR